MMRVTTGGVLKSYRSSLMKAYISQSNAMNTITSQRTFNSYAEDPSSAAKAFRLRKSRMTVQSQYNTCDATLKKYETGISSLQSLANVLDTSDGGPGGTLKGTTLAMLNDPQGDARVQLNKVLDQMSEMLVQDMNQKYGDNFIFAGADGHNVPFNVEDGKLYYRGVPVDAAEPDPAAEKLDYLANDEKMFVDIGLGFQEREDGTLIESSAFNAALSGINFLGYGMDEDNYPKNLYSLVQMMKDVSGSVPEAGNWDDATYEEFNRLVGKFETACSSFKTAFANMDASSTKLKSNAELLNDNYYNLQEQYAELEDMEPVEAINNFLWAQYSYNAALKVGNSVLSQSLMDYLNS